MAVTENQGGRYLSFVLGDNLYAIPVGQVEVVLEMQPITRVPNAKKNIRGVINHRGSVVPVIDLASSFEMENRQAADSNSIVVLQIEFEGELISFGMLADGVREVIELDASHIEAVPDLAKSRINGMADSGEKFVQAIAHVNNGFIILVDMDALFQEVAA